MGKNPNSKSKPVKHDEPMTSAMKFFLCGCVAELYLLVVRRFYINGTLEQVVSWDSYLNYLLYAGLAVAVIGVVLSVVWRKAPKLRTVGWIVLGAGVFLAVANYLIRTYVAAAVTLLCVVVPVAMLLGILWSLYDRECAWALTVLGASLIMLWICRREMNSMYLGTTVKVLAVIYIILLAAVAVMAHQADKNNGLIGKVRVLPADADVLPVYVACGLSAAAMVVALVSTTIAYYAIWALAIVAFALAVYYTVKQL